MDFFQLVRLIRNALGGAEEGRRTYVLTSIKPIRVDALLMLTLLIQSVVSWDVMFGYGKLRGTRLWQDGTHTSRSQGTELRVR